MLSFLSSNNTPGRVSPVKYHLCSICTSNKNKTLKTINFSFPGIFSNLLWSKFWNHFQVEIIPWSLMFLDFLTVFHMVWKSQENCESWLDRFWFSWHSKIQKILVNYFFYFWAPIMDLLTALKYIYRLLSKHFSTADKWIELWIMNWILNEFWMNFEWIMNWILKFNLFKSPQYFFVFLSGKP